MNRARFQAIASRFPSLKLLVVGDLILDRFIWGKVRRISPEAPVPIVEVERETSYPGGAANVARNLREYGGEVYLLGQIGTCAEAAHLRELLVQNGIRLDVVLEDPACQTIVKTRIIAQHQQVVRVDRERKSGPDAVQIGQLMAKLEALIGEVDGVILEDYGKGFLSQPLIDAIVTLAARAGKIITVDPNPANSFRWEGVTTVKPNRLEAFSSAGRAMSAPVDPPTRDTALCEVGQNLLNRWGTRDLLITLGEQGMMLFRREGEPFHIPTRAREVYDVSGAGDTTIALFTLALCAGATPVEAAEIANRASGIVVGKLGTATVAFDELLESFEA